MSRLGCGSGSADPATAVGSSPIGVVTSLWRATHVAVPDKDKPVSQRDTGQIGQVVDLVKQYAQQETLGPIKGAGRWLAVGAAGAMLIGTGCVFVVLGAAANDPDRVR